jgi:hypothetical protein
MASERRELENRRNGHLRQLLGDPLPGESSEELERLASEDETRAEQKLLKLMNPDGEITYKYIDDTTPEDHTTRIAAEGALVEWFAERTGTRDSS